MADSYSFVKGGKLKLKGTKKKSHKKHKKHHRKREREEGIDESEEDSKRHGDWWEVTKFEEIHGSIAIEIGNMTYIEALDNGLFKLGAPHNEGDEPTPEEILTAVKLSETKLALKSGYDKYLSVSPTGKVAARSDAIGAREQWEPVFQEGQLALLGCNSCFISVADDDELVCTSTTAGTAEIIKIAITGYRREPGSATAAILQSSALVNGNEAIRVRSGTKREKKLKSDVPEEETGNLKSTEINYVKKFQSFQDRHLRINPEDRRAVRQAKDDGNLHEVLLDRREKMKSDKFCK